MEAASITGSTFLDEEILQGDDDDMEELIVA